MNANPDMFTRGCTADLSRMEFDPDCDKVYDTWSTITKTLHIPTTIGH